jgi:hypothetical protein
VDLRAYLEAVEKRGEKITAVKFEYYGDNASISDEVR